MQTRHNYIYVQCIKLKYLRKLSAFNNNTFFKLLYLYEDGGWSDRGSCSVTCGGGYRSQRRLCDNPQPSPFGRSCLGNDEREGICNNIPCKGEL